MKKPFFILIAAAFMLSACDSTHKTTASATGTDSTQSADSLTAYLSVPAGTATKDSVPLVFTVKNLSSKKKSFCKWHTPFEPLLSKYLDVTAEDGTEANYQGAMAKRIMPPPPASYIQVAPGDSLSVRFNLLKGYSIPKPGKYHIKYNSSGVSGLKAGNEVSVTIP